MDSNEPDSPYINHNTHLAALPNYANVLLTPSEADEVVGDAATDWTVHGSTMTFEFHDGITFHNGNAATAARFAFFGHEPMVLTMASPCTPSRTPSGDLRPGQRQPPRRVRCF